jgi:hypothetical protein
MKALVLYILFVAIGGLISVGIGYFVEIEVSSTASLIVFLALWTCPGFVEGCGLGSGYLV